MLTRLIRSILWVVFFGVISGCAATAPERYPLPAAHRADRAAGMDNSAVAIQSAAKARVPFIEVDVRPTADRQFVLYHDKHFHRKYFNAPTIPDGVPVEELSLDALRAQRFADGSGIPLAFREGLLLLRGSHSVMLLDVKGATPERLTLLMQQVVDLGQEANVVVQCQAVEAARFLATHYREIHFLARLHKDADLAEYLMLRPYIVQLDPEMAIPEHVNRIKAAGARVLIKAVDSKYDSPQGWRALKELGADIVLTDYPKDLGQRAGLGRDWRETPAQ
jgi:glycerophosphoryl diester phosphodiesterase